MSKRSERTSVHQTRLTSHPCGLSVLSVVRGCISPKQMLHGKVQELSLNTGHALKFQCDNGYNLVGDPLVVCIGGNAWSSAFPTCQREDTFFERIVTGLLSDFLPRGSLWYHSLSNTEAFQNSLQHH